MIASAFAVKAVVRLLALVILVGLLLPLLATVLFALSSYLSDFAVFALPLPAAQVAKAVFALRIVVIAVAVSWAYFFLADQLSRHLCGRSLPGVALNEALQPWLFIGPALLLILLFLIYPALETFRLSLLNEVPVLDLRGEPVLNEAGRPQLQRVFVWFANYRYLLASEDFWLAIRNSVMWLAVVPTSCIVLGMTIAVLADRLVWGKLAKILIFVPMAISFVGAAVIWRNIYAAGGAGGYELGLVNALLKPFGVEPRFWYETKFWGNFFLMSIMIWIQTGFAMVMFSAALRAVPIETIEAARIDGANEAQIFFKVSLPQIYGTVLVLWTTMTIMGLKVFDIPYALTANKADKLLLATLMEQTRTAQREDEIAAAVAVILMLTITPIMIFTVWRNRREARNA